MTSKPRPTLTSLDKKLDQIIATLSARQVPVYNMSDGSNATNTVSKTPTPVRAEMERLVKTLTDAGFHTHADGIGMSKEEYAQKWLNEETVQQVQELANSYHGRFDKILLVDNTISLPLIAQMSDTYLWQNPDNCRDIVDAPTGEDGELPKRYVAFFQDGTAHLSEDHTVEWCRAHFAEDEVGLVSRELLHLPVEHEPVLRHHGVDGAGSSFGVAFAPYVYWFGSAQPYFDAGDVGLRSAGYGSGSRGIQVVSVR